MIELFIHFLSTLLIPGYGLDPSGCLKVSVHQPPFASASGISRNIVIWPNYSQMRSSDIQPYRLRPCACVLTKHNPLIWEKLDRKFGKLATTITPNVNKIIRLKNTNVNPKIAKQTFFYKKTH